MENVLLWVCCPKVVELCLFLRDINGERPYDFSGHTPIFCVREIVLEKSWVNIFFKVVYVRNLVSALPSCESQVLKFFQETAASCIWISRVRLSLGNPIKFFSRSYNQLIWPIQWSNIQVIGMRSTVCLLGYHS